HADGAIRHWRADPQTRCIAFLGLSLTLPGMVNDLKLTDSTLIAACGTEPRLGRWVTRKGRPAAANRVFFIPCGFQHQKIGETLLSWLHQSCTLMPLRRCYSSSRIPLNADLLRRIEKNPSIFAENCRRRRAEVDIDAICRLNQQRRALIQQAHECSSLRR